MSGYIQVFSAPGAAPKYLAVQGDLSLSSSGFAKLGRSGVRPGTYDSVTVDAKGRVVAGTARGTIGPPVVLVSSCPDPDVSVVRTDRNIHTINIPDASMKSRGLMTPEDFRLAVSRDGVLVCRGPGTVPRGDVEVAPDGTVSLAETGVKPGTYYSVTVDAKGRVTAGNESRFVPGLNGSPGALESVRVDGEIRATSVDTDRAEAGELRAGKVVSEYVQSDNDLALSSGGTVSVDAANFHSAARRFAIGGKFVKGYNAVHGPLVLGGGEVKVDANRVSVTGKFTHNGTEFPSRYGDGTLKVVDGKIVSVPDPRTPEADEADAADAAPEPPRKVKWTFPEVVLGKENALVKVAEISDGEVKLALANPRFSGKFEDFVDVIPPALVLADDPDEMISADTGAMRRGSMAITGEGVVRVSVSSGTVLAAPL